MNDRTKAAYRHLLYVAMLAIRRDCEYRSKESWNPFEWHRRYRLCRVAEAVADWLHNPAQFSSLDFAGFDEQWFWTEYSSFCRRLASEGLERYREIFDQHLAGGVRLV